MGHQFLELKVVWLSLSALVCFQFAQAQTEISGKVTDALTGEGIPGVNIMVLGTSRGTVSDLNGIYSISANESEVLVISFVGFLSQEILVGNQSVIDIQLEEDITSLAEIVVTGYGIQQIKEVSSDITSVKRRKFQCGDGQ